MTLLISHTWQCDPALSHIFAGAVRIAGFTWLVALQEEELARAFVGVDLCGQRRGIGKLQRHMTFPARFQRSDVNDDAAAGISALAQPNDQHVTGNPKIFNCARQRETVGRDDAAVCLTIDQALAVEILGSDERAIDMGENPEYEYGK